jgi:uncharacterized protein with von Willebrand factor type A (vWA) domain
MFLPFFLELKAAKVPVSLREYLTLIEGLVLLPRPRRHGEGRAPSRPLRPGLRPCLRRARGRSAPRTASRPPNLPAEWLEKLAEKHLTEEERREIEALGGFDKLMETLRKRLEEQKGRHQGGSKWIGTAGTSPFGAYGYNPEGVRIGQHESRHRRAVKVWDKREFRNLDDSVELGTRNIKVAMKRLRQWARDGAAEELDLDGTIRATAEHGYLDVKTRPERRNAVKVILFLDVGGSMDDHVKVVEELFLRRPRRVQAPGILLLPQLPLRRRLARQPPALDRDDPDP